MGNKAHIRANRLGIISGWDASWYAPKKAFAQCLYEDCQIRAFLEKQFPQIIGKITVARAAGAIITTIHTPKPGIIIGPNGQKVQQISQTLKKKINKDIRINILEIKVPELNALLVAKNIAAQLEARTSYKRAAHIAMGDAMQAGASGIKIFIKGRPNGIEIARKITFMKGRLPTQTLRADIDFAHHDAKTTAGIVGVKVWIFTKEVYGKRDLSLSVQKASPSRKKRKTNY